MEQEFFFRDKKAIVHESKSYSCHKAIETIFHFPSHFIGLYGFESLVKLAVFTFPGSMFETSLLSVLKMIWVILNLTLKQVGLGFHAKVSLSEFGDIFGKFLVYIG